MKFSNTLVPGIIGIIGAPWIFIDFINNGLYEHFLVSSASGVRNLLFMTGWISSLLGLYVLGVMRDRTWKKIIFILQLIFLLLAEAWCVMEIFPAGRSSPFFYTLNYSWHVGGCLMLLTGLVIVKEKKLKGWNRFTPLLAGIWFPLTLFIYLLTGNSRSMILVSGIYSIIIFSLLGFSVATADNPGSTGKTKIKQYDF